MNKASNNRFSGPVTVFHDRRLPEPASPAGYAALIDAYGLAVPLPRTLHAVGLHHRIVEAQGWRILTPRHAPHPSLEGHLTFALKYEGLDLVVLKRLFLACSPGDISAIITRTPTGSYARRIWFLYEWLLGKTLDVASASTGSYVTVLDPEQQYGVAGENASRHRVRNNLPGTSAFCPLVFRTSVLDRFIALDLAGRARAAVAKVPADLLARTAAFLLLKDSRSSYVIEGERPPQNRVERWGQAIGQAGKAPIDQDELLRLQKIVIGDARFVHLGLRQVGGFVGEHARDTGTPIPAHISARPDDLPLLVAGMAEFDRSKTGQLDPVIAAAMLAFGFVYAHPFEDGNGRIHRYLIHHILAERGFSPDGLIFPISSAILERIGDYRKVLESYSRRLLPLVQWKPTKDGNVNVLNDTADFYRFFDATPQAEFLYSCVQMTIEEDLPRETEFLRRFDQFRARLQAVVDMPDRMLSNLYGFLRQNSGRLSGRARQNEFKALSDSEVTAIETVYQDLFGAT